MMDDFKPKKPASPARINRASIQASPTPPPELDEEIGDAFAPPDEVAATDPNEEALTIDNETADESAPTSDKSDSKSKNKLSKKDKTSAETKPKLVWWPPKVWTKKQWLIVGSITLVVLLVIAGAYYVFFKKPGKQATVSPPPAVATPPKPTTVPSPLTGIQVTPEQSKLPVTGIMIENSLDARPQSGLDQAGVVYEAVAEGGITRFLALFEETQPDYVGPVRSSRPYYLRWLLPFDAGYAHVGGSPDALSDIKKLGVKDLDQFYNAGAYQRITSRAAPHNVYTSLSSLISLEKTKKYDTSSFTGFTRKVEEPSKAPVATAIDFTISGPDYSVHYAYDATTNSYKRSEGGAAHMVIDKTGQQTQLQPKVVVALIMPQSLDPDGHHTQYDTIGSGQMFVFQDGIVTPGSWSKADDKSQFVFSDNIGKPLALNPGQTWISILGLSGDVAYK